MTLASQETIDAAGEAGATGPYPTYQALRRQGPIVWSGTALGGAWLLTTFDGVQAALKDPRLSARRTGDWVLRKSGASREERRQLLGLQRSLGGAMLFRDRPAHPRLRQVLQSGFHPARVLAIQDFIDRTIGELIDDLERRAAGNRPVDFIPHFARKLPARVIAHFLGLDGVDHDQFASWSTALAKLLGTLDPTPQDTRAARDSAAALTAGLADRLRRAEFSDDTLIGRIVAAQRRGDISDSAEALSQCAMLLFAGYETTRHFLGTAVYWLLERPARWRALREARTSDPSLLRLAILELLRWDSPVQYTARRAAGAFTLLGQQVRRGDLVLPLIGAANRDPARYGNPDSLDLRRAAGMPLSFGTGPHVCIGAALTLTEAERALTALLARWPDASLADDPGSVPPRWIDLPLYRGLESLMIRRHPTA